MDLSDLIDEKYKKSKYGAAHVDPADAYRAVPFLKEPVWKNEIAAYFFLGGISAGSGLLGSLAGLFGGSRYERLAETAHYVSFAAFVPCPVLLIDDLGVPSKFYHMLRIFKPSSPMNLGTWAVALHGAAATALVLRLLASRNKVPFSNALLVVPESLLAALGIPGSLVLAGYTGVLLGTTSIPVWYTSNLLGALFTSSSLSTGAAALQLASLSDRREALQKDSLRWIRLASDASSLVAFAAYIKTTGKAAGPLWTGRRRYLNAASLVGIVCSLLLGTVRWSKAVNLLGALFALASGALMRWGIVDAGRTSALDRPGALQSMRATANRPGWTPPD